MWCFFLLWKKQSLFSCFYEKEKKTENLSRKQIQTKPGELKKRLEKNVVIEFLKRKGRNGRNTKFVQNLYCKTERGKTKKRKFCSRIWKQNNIGFCLVFSLWFHVFDECFFTLSFFITINIFLRAHDVFFSLFCCVHKCVFSPSFF